jgi:hypothetical protein
MRRFAHQLERGIDQAARLFRVEVLDQLHVAPRTSRRKSFVVNAESP